MRSSCCARQQLLSHSGWPRVPHTPMFGVWGTLALLRVTQSSSRIKRDGQRRNAAVRALPLHVPCCCTCGGPAYHTTGTLCRGKPLQGPPFCLNTPTSGGCSNTQHIQLLGHQRERTVLTPLQDGMTFCPLQLLLAAPRQQCRCRVHGAMRLLLLAVLAALSLRNLL